MPMAYLCCLAKLRPGALTGKTEALSFSWDPVSELTTLMPALLPFVAETSVLQACIPPPQGSLASGVRV